MLLSFRSVAYLPLLVLVLLLGLSNHGATAKSSTQTTYSAASTCASKTLNYITATLPQQCLRTGWSSERVPGKEIRPDHVPTHNTSASSNTTIAATVGSTSGSSSIELSTATSQSSANAAVTVASDLQDSTTPTLTPPQNSTDGDSLAEAEADSDPLSDNASFLSFEEWKAQMLQKAGQSPEHVSGSGIEKEGVKNGREPGGINNALDSLGEEGEIEIAFGGFVAPDATATAIPTREAQAGDPKNSEANQEIKEDKPRKHNKEAGTTSKQRFNYASFDCAATVRKTNPGCKGATSILLENQDSYMLNTCSTNNKFLIVELCNDILIDTIVLGNFEFFSSTFKEFRVSVSDRYPVKSDKWKEIGTFQARNTRGVQAFLVENGVIWARYLRVEFLSHYGKEYYCPVSLLRAHGKTMMDDYRADVKASRGEEDNDDEDAEDEPAEKVVAELLKESSSLEAKPTEIGEAKHGKNAEPSSHWQDTPVIDKCPRQSLSSPLIQQAELYNSMCERSNRFCNMGTVHVIKHSPVSALKDTGVLITVSATPPGPIKDHAKTEVPAPENQSATSTVNQASMKPTSTDLGSKMTPPPSKVKDRPAPMSTEALGESSKASSKNSETTGSTKTQSDHPTASTSKVPSTAVPATQESFFKSVHKRLQQLETNSTLSLQYIEEQSRILREAFTKVEKRQLSKTSTFLETLNTTVLSELREFRLQYDQIWQSTVLELSSQREQSQKEVTALSQRLTLLADEILWQKRIAYLQFGLILLCLGLVIFPRNQANAAGSFDLQSMVGKPTASFARYLNLDSPPGTPSRPGSRYGLFSRRMTYQRGISQDALSDEDGVTAPNIKYQLPTPTPSSSGEEEQGLDSLLNSPDGDPLIRRAQSTPNLAKESDDLLESPDQEEVATKWLGEEGSGSPD
ncbi:hypothetical protein MMC10_007996 [Thelotrema lepadinum]|nr:hypothetical protein [Thelotrema lepadinum]